VWSHQLELNSGIYPTHHGLSSYVVGAIGFRDKRDGTDHLSACLDGYRPWFNLLKHISPGSKSRQFNLVDLNGKLNYNRSRKPSDVSCPLSKGASTCPMNGQDPSS